MAAEGGGMRCAVPPYACSTDGRITQRPLRQQVGRMQSAFLARVSLMMKLRCSRRHLALTLYQRLELLACSFRCRYSFVETRM
jgi:hypothetical protein